MSRTSAYVRVTGAEDARIDADDGWLRVRLGDVTLSAEFGCEDGVVVELLSKALTEVQAVMDARED